MKNLLYIGNRLSNENKTPTSIETLGVFLEKEGFYVKTASSKPNKILRLFDMLFTVLLTRRKLDYVLIDTYSTANFYFAYAVSQLCRILNLKYIPILRGGGLPNRLKNSPKLSRAIFNHAYKNVAPSLFIKSRFEKIGYSNIVCIPNSIELQKYTFKQRTTDVINLLWVRSFSGVYNPLLAIDVLKSFKNNQLDAMLCMIGPENDGSLEETKRYANSLNLNVEFPGKLTKAEWHKKAENFNIFINTTNVDNTPVSVIEAMALGLPIVSTNVGGMPFLIDNGVDGILVEPNDINAFNDAIKNLIDNKDFAMQMSKNARHKVEQFDWNIVKEKWISLLS